MTQRNNKRFFSAIIGVGLLSLGTHLKADPGELVVWAMGEEGKKIAAVAKRFEQENPGVKVVTQPIPWDAAHEKLLTSVVGGIPPDVSQIGTTWMAEFVTMNALEPLDDRMKMPGPANENSFFSGSLTTCRVKNSLYGVPWYVDTRVLFYRKDLLADVGFSQAPQTWAELKKACQALTRDMNGDGKIDRYGMALPVRGWLELCTTIWQNDGNPLQPTSPEFSEAFDFYLSFFREKIVPTKEAADVDVIHAFKRGFYPMFISGPWMVEILNNELPDLRGRWGVSVLPGNKKRTSFVGGSNLVVFRNSAHKELAWKFIEFMSRADIQSEWFRTTRDLPSVRNAWLDPYLSGQPMIRVFGDQMDDTNSPPTIPEWEQIANAIDNSMERIILQDSASPEGSAPYLEKLQSKINEILDMGKPKPPPWRSFFMTLIGIGVLAVLSIVGWTVYQSKKGTGCRAKHLWADRVHRFFQTYMFGYIFIFPCVILLVVFLFIPLVSSFFMSLTDWNIFGMNDWNMIRFVGWANYIRTVKDPLFWKSLGNTLYFAGVGVPITIVVSLAAAVALNQSFVRARPVFRAAFFAPVVTTIVAVAVVWRWLYNPEYGLLNWLLQVMGMSPQNWLSDVRLAMPSLILMAIWKNFGYNMVVFLAGLQTIPETLYEAARMDGANSWQCFRHVTLPGLRPTMLFVVIMTTIGYLQFFAESYVMTKGGPLNSTLSIVLYMYNQGFKFFNLGYASAIAYVLFGIIFAFTIVQLMVKRSSYEGN